MKIASRNGYPVALVLVPLVMMLILATVAEAASSTGKKGKKPTRVEREVSQEYTTPTGLLLVSADVSVCVQDQSCLTFMAERRESYVSISIADQTGTPAPFRVELNGTSQTFCGDTAGPLFLNGVSDIHVSALAGALPNCAGVGTSGSVTATFSNLP